MHIENGQINLQDRIHEYEKIQERAIKENNIKIIEEHYKTRKIMNIINEIIYLEKLDEFIRKVKLMKAILTLNSFDIIGISEIDKVKNLIKEVEDLAKGCKTSICSVCGLPLILKDNRDKQYHKSCRVNSNTARTRERLALTFEMEVEKGLFLDTNPTLNHFVAKWLIVNP